MKVSVVSPVYCAEGCLDELVDRVLFVLEPLGVECEIILVEDAGPDRSWERIEDICRNEPRVRGFKLSRNFGQHHAITAGLDQVSGDVVIVMDCDLQDRPEEIPALLAKLREGFDVVLARRADRRDSLLKRTVSKLFYSTLGYFSGSEQDAAVANFGAYNIRVIHEVCKLRESIRYFPTMVKWVGFRTARIDVQHDPRMIGASSYDLRRLMRLALDILLAHSDRPLRIMVKVGLWITLTSIAVAVYILVRSALGTITVLGYASLMVSIWFLSGVIISTLGVVGIYVGKTFEGVKSRPLYIIERRA